MIRQKDLMDWLPLVCVLGGLWLMMVMSGCAVSAQLMTNSQHRARTMDRVLIDRAHGSYEGDRATKLRQYRERYGLAGKLTE